MWHEAFQTVPMNFCKGATAYSGWETSSNQRKAPGVKGPKRKKQEACGRPTDAEMGPYSKEPGSCLQTDLIKEEIKRWHKDTGPPCTSV